MIKEVREKIIKDTAKYSSAYYLTQGIGFITATAMRRFLGPYCMGIWSILQVIQSYFGYLYLGVDDAAAYKIPFYRGNNDKVAEHGIRDTAFSFIFLISIISSSLLILAAVVLRKHYPVEIIIGLLALAIYIILQRLYSFYVISLRAYKNFSVLSKSILFDGVTNLLLVFFLVSKFKLYGVYITISILAVLNTLFVHRLAKYDINLKFSLACLKSLILFGFPLLINSVLSEILRTIDRIMIAKMMGVLFVGYYSIAIMSKGFISGLSANLSIVSIPHLQEIYGKNKNIDDIKKFVTIPTTIFSYLLSPIIGLLYIVSPLFIKIVLPKYIPGICAMQILLFDTIFISCNQLTVNFLATINKQARVIPINLCAIILNIFLNYIFIKKGWGINGVALATISSSFFIFVTMLTYALRHFSNFKEITAFIFKTILPLFYIIAVVVGLNHFINFSNPYLELILGPAVLIIVSVPLFIEINKKTHILSLLLNVTKDKLKIFMAKS
jgi:O-antigen/teichoic acid export membrane protein